MDEDILSYEDHQIIQNDAWENGFKLNIENLIKNDKKILQQYYNSLLQFQKELEKAISENQINIETYSSFFGNKKIERKKYTTKNKDIQIIFLNAAKTLYSLRTFITGEEIYFLENFDGVERVIKQKDWLSMLSVNSNDIVLL